MAKDDYHVIVYQILAYLYVQLKTGEPVDGDMIRVERPAKNGVSFNEMFREYWINKEKVKEQYPEYYLLIEESIK